MWSKLPNCSLENCILVEKWQSKLKVATYQSHGENVHSGFIWLIRNTGTRFLWKRSRILRLRTDWEFIDYICAYYLSEGAVPWSLALQMYTLAAIRHSQFPNTVLKEEPKGILSERLKKLWDGNSCFEGQTACQKVVYCYLRITAENLAKPQKKNHKHLYDCRVRLTEESADFKRQVIYTSKTERTTVEVLSVNVEEKTGRKNYTNVVI